MKQTQSCFALMTPIALMDPVISPLAFVIVRIQQQLAHSARIPTTALPHQDTNALTQEPAMTTQAFAIVHLHILDQTVPKLRLALKTVIVVLVLVGMGC